MISRILPLLLLCVCLPLMAEQRLPEDYWQELLLETRNAGMERQLAEEARLQLRQEARDTQALALSEARKAQAEAETRRKQLEEQQLQLEEELQETQERLQRRSASLGEVFSVYQDAKSSLYGLLSDALVIQQTPDLLETFRPDHDQGVPGIQALEELWQGLQKTWLASGQVVSFTTNWVDSEGSQQTGSVVRLGDIQLLNEQGLLRFESGQPAVLWPRQPGEARQQAEDFVAGIKDEVTLDPARGQTLRLYSHQPDLLERIQQGGYVGYLIIFLGSLGLLVALVQSLRLVAENQRVKHQLQQLEDPQTSNSLGRVLAGLRRETVSASIHPEALEARMDELLLREAAGLERGLSWVKLLAAMAPLLGLLGTVTGMIATFQAITLFGTGDPAMMASGISQALMTTVLGLVTAVPLLLAHLLLQGRSRHLARTLEAETSAWLSNRLGSQTVSRS
jgi:biopolymer transport protein ExbB